MRAPTVSFVSSKIVPEDLAMELAKEKIGIANGNCYAYRLMNAIGVEPSSGVARISFVHYKNPSEIEKLMLALDKIILKSKLIVFLKIHMIKSSHTNKLGHIYKESKCLQ